MIAVKRKVRMIGENKVIAYIVYENLKECIIADFFSYAFLLACFWINHVYIGSRLLSGVLLIMCLFLIKSFSRNACQEYEDIEKLTVDFKKEFN